MEIYYNKIEEGEFIETIVGNKCKSHIIKLGKNGVTIVELLDWDLKLLYPSEKRLFNNGITHFALTVDNIDKTYKLMVENGIIFISNPKINDDNTAIVAFCNDYEGNFIELVEII
tara:strand:+ start:123 stop:467 length:345 start_codon:yes stop_codon:yes gene_type:complete